MSDALRPFLGGTFDPIHNGHLRCALEVAEWCGAPVTLLPSGRPGHRETPAASPRERWRLLELATAGVDRLRLDDRELRRAGPSYTVDTLEALAAEAPGEAVVLILGADAFAGLDRWHRWQRVVELARFVVVPRPGEPLRPAPALMHLFQERRVDTPSALARGPGGTVAVVPVTAQAISATALRARLAAGLDPAFLVPRAVRDRLLARNPYAAAPAPTPHSPDDGGHDRD